MGEPLPEALAYMQTNDFSQIIIECDHRYVILSGEGIAHWLEYKSTEDIISLVETKLGDVFHFEPKDTCIYLSANDTIDEARERFTKDIGKRVISALVSDMDERAKHPSIL